MKARWQGVEYNQAARGAYYRLERLTEWLFGA